MHTVPCELCRADHAEPVFRQKDLSYGTSGEEFVVVRCVKCCLLYLNPRPGPDEIGRYYPPQYFSPPSLKSRSGLAGWIKAKSLAVKRAVLEDFYGYPAPSRSRRWRTARRFLLWPERLRRAIKGRHPIAWVGRGRVLDVGCGWGVNLVSLQRDGWDVHGLDVSEMAVRSAQERFGDRVRWGDLHSVHYDEKSFDVVLFSHSLEHMFHPRTVLTEVRRILQEQGRVVITVPNAGGWEARLFGRWWFPLELPRHLYHFEQATLVKLLEQTGFEVVATRTGVGTLYFMASADRVWQHTVGGSLPLRRLVETLVARPFCLLAGHLGQGTEMTITATVRYQ